MFQRGNDKYNSKLRHKFDGLKKINKKGVFAKFFTITTDIKKYNSIEEAWLDLGRRFNRFNSYLKKFYNDRFLGFVRVFEAFKSGYPHVHGILFFSKRTYLKDFKFRKTVGAFVKFKNIRSIDGSLGYIGKYLTGGSEKKKSNLRFTQALLWLFKKRSFSFSHSLRNLIHDLHNSNHQLDLFGNVVVSEWLFIGVFLPSELVFEEGFNGNQWIYRLKEVPDPPSKDFNFDYNQVFCLRFGLNKQKRKKLKEKSLDMVIANRPSAIGADENYVDIKMPNKNWLKTKKQSKPAVATQIIRIIENIHRPGPTV